MSKGIEFIVVVLLGLILGTAIGTEVTVFEIKRGLPTAATEGLADCRTMAALIQMLQNREDKLGIPRRHILDDKIVERCVRYGASMPPQPPRELWLSSPSSRTGSRR